MLTRLWHGGRRAQAVDLENGPTMQPIPESSEYATWRDQAAHPETPGTSSPTTSSTSGRRGSNAHHASRMEVMLLRKPSTLSVGAGSEGRFVSERSHSSVFEPSATAAIPVAAPGHIAASVFTSSHGTHQAALEMSAQHTGGRRGAPPDGAGAQRRRLSRRTGARPGAPE
eukprot:CAMPEP_0176330756 /NCGR_PEP_ID=MMETSP0121_2-20121125/76189_1 /TAXON_ID=160619 /ORGANISM="Kryptoperidinium foliaceum, Strain CCMP 1326" /LENGTH=169 /DNA_ID=CAMNT_0017673561 /DNA_START=42 /DNA_END=548 /DNA_ORIENTATION=-